MPSLTLRGGRGGWRRCSPAKGSHDAHSFVWVRPVHRRQCENRCVATPIPDAPAAPGFAARIGALEARELSPLATRSYPALRELPEENCGVRTPFQHDRDRIVHSKAFRRLKHKTQVFI